MCLCHYNVWPFGKCAIIQWNPFLFLVNRRRVRNPSKNILPISVLNHLRFRSLSFLIWPTKISIGFKTVHRVTDGVSEATCASFLWAPPVSLLSNYWLITEPKIIHSMEINTLKSRCFMYFKKKVYWFFKPLTKSQHHWAPPIKKERG